MRKKKPRVVSLDEVKITRRGDTAEFEYADEAMGSMCLKLGVDVSGMSDDELLEHHNETVRAMDAVAASRDHVAIEVPVGSPQLRYAAQADQWVPRGAVVRCVVHDGTPKGVASVEIDGRAFSLHEFGRMLTTYAGWGMRLVFVPDDELHDEPVIEVREPDDGGGRGDPPVEEVAATTARSRSATGKMAARDMRTQRMPIYQLRVTLADTEPPVWRGVLASGNLSLKKLHEIIQAAMGWTNSHLHLFASADGKDVVCDPRSGLDRGRDEAKVKLRSFAPDVGSRFRYEYDFGDAWRHDVVVEEILAPGTPGHTPRCVGGQRTCPPEDCGGVPGYATLVAAMQDPRHPERGHYLEWFNGEFDPDAFDLDVANRRLRLLK